jgi:putative tryptophan/tyrosine transport system substrate-binding protein
MRRREFIAALGGTAVAWPLAARAQKPALPVIGYLSAGSSSPGDPAAAAFHRGLRELGYIEGRNVEIVYRWAEIRYDRLPALAADLVRGRVAVIVAIGGSVTALAAKSATATIPIVFAFGADPVELGLVSSLNSPGGNVTGGFFLTRPLTPKRFQLLHEMVPAATSIGFLVNPTTPGVDADLRQAEIAARTLGARLVIVNARTPSEIEAAFAVLVEQRVDAFLAAGDLLFAAQGNQLAALAARHSVPAIYINRGIVDAGGLMSYGANAFDAFRLAGTYAGRILNGERPADLPVQQATRIEFVLNLKTAKSLGLTVPNTLLVAADEVIE